MELINIRPTSIASYLDKFVSEIPNRGKAALIGATAVLIALTIFRCCSSAKKAPKTVRLSTSSKALLTRMKAAMDQDEHVHIRGMAMGARQEALRRRGQ